MVENLFNVYLGEESAKLIADSKKLNIDKSLKRIAVNAIDAVGTLALNAARSAVPWDTSELRDQIITKTSPSPTASLPQSTVFIAQVTHYGRDQKPIPAGLLADILETGRAKSGKPMKRSQPSKNEPGFPSYSGFTAEWIEKAENNFYKKLPATLRRNFNY